MKYLWISNTLNQIDNDCMSNRLYSFICTMHIVTPFCYQDVMADRYFTISEELDCSQEEWKSVLTDSSSTPDDMPF